MRIVFCGGGTAGHIMPNIALIEALKGNEIHYLGCSEMDRTLLEPMIKGGELTYHGFEAVKLRRKLSPGLFLLPIRLQKSVADCRRILKKIKPEVVFSKGGYAGLPVVMASRGLGCRAYCHESDLTLGLANRVSLSYVKHIFTAFKATADKIGKKAIYSGIPLKSGIYMRSRARGRGAMGFNNARKTVLILGGSLGAARLNKAIEASLKILTTEYNVFMICGKGKLSGSKNEFFKEIEFTDSIGDLYEACDFIISRAGSNTISEILTVQKPSILVPLTKATRGEQIDNARYCEANGFALYMDEAEITGETLMNKIAELKQKSKLILEKQRLTENNAVGIILKHISENPY